MSKETITLSMTEGQPHDFRADFYLSEKILIVSHADNKVLPNADTERRIHAAAKGLNARGVSVDPTKIRVFEMQPPHAFNTPDRHYSQILGITRDWQGLTCDYESVSHETAKMLEGLK